MSKANNFLKDSKFLKHIISWRIKVFKVMIENQIMMIIYLMKLGHCVEKSRDL